MKKLVFSTVTCFVLLILSVKLFPVLAYCPVAISRTEGNLRYSFNNQWKHYVMFRAPYTGKVDLVDIKVGNWGNAWRHIDCKVTNGTGTKNISVVGTSAVFKASGVEGSAWRGVDFSGDKSFTLTRGQNYRLYCRGSDSWNSLYWIYNRQGDPGSKTFEIFMCRT